MKRILLLIVGLAGVGGLIALLTYHPTSGSPAASTDVPLSASSSPNSSSPASPSPSSSATTAAYKNGTYTGSAVNVSYGTVQVQAVIASGKITAINVLQMPNDSSHAQQLTAQAKPILVQEALTAQSSDVDAVSGATLDSEGFDQSLADALSQASS